MSTKSIPPRPRGGSRGRGGGGYCIASDLWHSLQQLLGTLVLKWDDRWLCCSVCDNIPDYHIVGMSAVVVCMDVHRRSNNKALL